MVKKYICTIDDLEIFPRLGMFSRVEIGRLCEIMEIREYDKGEYIYKEGEPSDFLAAIVSGTVLLQRGGKIICKTKKASSLGRRHMFGYDAFSTYPRNVSVRTLEPTKLLIILNQKRDHFDDKYPKTAMTFYRLLLSYNSLQLRYLTGILEKEGK